MGIVGPVTWKYTVLLSILFRIYGKYEYYFVVDSLLYMYV